MKATIARQKAALPHGEKTTLGHGALDPNNIHNHGDKK
jgi:hypothetical protein